MFGEFEDAKDTENANDDERSAALGRLTVALGLLDGQYHEVRQDRQNVYDIHHVQTELSLGRTGDQSHDQLPQHHHDDRPVSW